MLWGCVTSHFCLKNASYWQFCFSSLRCYMYVEKSSQKGPLYVIPPAFYETHPWKHQKQSRATTPLTKQVKESTVTQFRGSQASDQDGTSRCSKHLSGESLFCKGKANDWVFGGIQLLDLCAFKRLCYFTALWSKLISASYVNENWYSSLCSYSFLIPIIDWNF